MKQRREGRGGGGGGGKEGAGNGGRKEVKERDARSWRRPIGAERSGGDPERSENRWWCSRGIWRASETR